MGSHLSPHPVLPALYLALSLVGVAFTVAALVRMRRIGSLLIPWFFAGWLTSELSLFHVVWQAIATVLFVEAGVLHDPLGVAGLVLTVASWAGLLVAHARSRPTGDVFEEALSEGLGEGYVDELPPDRRTALREGVTRSELLRPFHMKRPGVERIADLPYGEAGRRNRLDIYRPTEPGKGRPVLLQIHGGAWVIGNKEQQGLPLMYHLAARGWVCVAVNYRLSPRSRFPAHLVDCKRALAWIRENIADYGGDPRFVAVTGGSAGGHLTSLVALTANRPELQPGFEDVDTCVVAAVPFYGVYDFTDRHGTRGHAEITPFLERTVMPCSPSEDPDLWDLASPIAQVHPGAPPFFVIHGTHDSLVFVEDARNFVATLRATSRKPVVYAELPGAQHAFDIFHSVRSAHAVNAVSRFLEVIRAREQGSSEAVTSPAVAGAPA